MQIRTRPQLGGGDGLAAALKVFPVVVTGSDVAHRKPAPDIYAKCCAELGMAYV